MKAAVALLVLVACGAAVFWAASARDGGAIAWSSAHDEALSRARQAKRAVMIDFTADWCAPCRELEEHTFSDRAVRREAAERFVALRLDASDPDAAMDALLRRYGVMGLPTIVFIDSQGEVLASPRVTGFVPPERFVALMRQVR